MRSPCIRCAAAATSGGWLHRRDLRFPAIALTAFARAEDRRRALEAGYHTHVPKPVEADELAAVVARLAGAGRANGDGR